jgi:acetyl esterase/lipase
MSEETPRHEITKKAVVYRLPGVEAVTVRRDMTYRVTEAGPLSMDLYSPLHSKSGARRPAVVFVIGFSDVGAQKILGCPFREMESYVSWARLVAASGMVAINYTNREPATDLRALLQHVRQDAESLGIDENRIGLWACSGNVPLALSLLMQERREPLRCVALLYGYTLDLDGSTGVAEAARTRGFVNACAGKSLDDLSPEVPLFIARAGADEMPGLNETLDRFLVKALGRNLPVTFVNHAAAPHAFDLFLDSETSRDVIRQLLGFLQCHLEA